MRRNAVLGVLGRAAIALRTELVVFMLVTLLKSAPTVAVASDQAMQGDSGESFSSLRSGEGASLADSASGQVADKAGEGLFALLRVMDPRAAKDLFGSRVARAYYVIEACIANTSKTVYAMTGLEFHDASGNVFKVIPSQLVGEQIGRHRRGVPLVHDILIVTKAEPVRTWLFVDKKNGALSAGALPAGTQLFADIGEGRLVSNAIATN